MKLQLLANIENHGFILEKQKYTSVIQQLNIVFVK